MWLLIDHYDSFTYILADYLKQLHNPIVIVKHAEVNLNQVIDLDPQRIILSPGPGAPEDCNLALQVIDYFHKKIPILGICLGHQAIGIYFGAQCRPSGKPMHGKTSTLKILHPHPIIEDIVDTTIMHYHSLIVVAYQDSPLIAIAVDDKYQLMICCHEVYPTIGIQFHPESILTAEGHKYLENWSKMYTN